MNYFTYILYSSGHDRYYVGQTDDLEARLVSHNETGIGTFTSKYRPWNIHGVIRFSSRVNAMKAEKYLKKKPRSFLERIATDPDLVEFIQKKFEGS